MAEVLAHYDRAVAAISGRVPESIMLLFLRVAFAGIFWRSGRTKVEEGSLFAISDDTYFLFSDEYAGVPLPFELAAVVATVAEHLFPVLLVAGLFVRLSALALLAMTMVIQFFVYPEAWWTVHALWVAMALVLVLQGGGSFTLDTLLVKQTRS